MSPWWAEGLMIRGELTIEQIIEQTAAMGVDGLDMQEVYLGLNPHPDPLRVRQLRRVSESHGLPVTSCWFYADTLGAAEMTSPAEVARHLQRYLAVGAEFGASYVVVQNGESAARTSAAQARDTLFRVYDAVAPFAEEVGVNLAFEAARPASRFNSPPGALELVKEFGSPHLSVAPDFEAWRRPTASMPTTYVENPDVEQPEPLAIDVLRDCLPFAPFVHAKFLEFDETGTDPNFPVDDLLSAIVNDVDPHDVLVEYEGWLPEVHPERAPAVEVLKAVQLVRAAATSTSRGV